MNEDEEASITPQPKRERAPRRARRTSVNIRIKDKLLETALEEAQRKQLTLDDLFEEGLWLVLQHKLNESFPETHVNDLSLITVLPSRVRRMIRPFALYMLTNFDDLIETSFRRIIQARLGSFEKDPRFLIRLGELLTAIEMRTTSKAMRRETNSKIMSIKKEQKEDAR